MSENVFDRLTKAWKEVNEVLLKAVKSITDFIHGLVLKVAGLNSPSRMVYLSTHGKSFRVRKKNRKRILRKFYAYFW